MDPNQNTPLNYRNRKPDNAFALDTTPRQFPTMESPQGGFINLLQSGSPIQQTPLFQQQYQPFPAFQQQQMQQQYQQFQQFQQLQQLQQQSSQQQQPPISQPPSSQPPLSPDFVPETQPSPPPQPKKKKGKKTARPTTTQEKVPWTKEEEENETRNADQITSKWRDIRLKCTEFGGIYSNLLNIRKSGSNDFDVFKAAMDQFEKTTPTRKAFPYMKQLLKLKDAPKWKEQTEGSSQSSGSKRSRNPEGTSQQSDDRTHIDINDDPIDLENDQPLRRPVGRNKAKKAASTSSNSSVMDMFGNKFDRYVQLQETKAEVMTRMEQKMIEAQTSFQEAQETLQTKTGMEILKMKADDLEGEDLELFQAMKKSVRARQYVTKLKGISSKGCSLKTIHLSNYLSKQN
uniref:No apical meristem-associated C-terminal domain-containing protein n=1 Tax=Lactuca sativa TaxID=4236 RepID=A0A9R1W109_LACSA|nr:hypothetical protein LSAT_V11C300127950 [Lactuca sativa]